MKKWIIPTLFSLLIISCKTKDLEYISFDHLKVEKLGLRSSTVSMEVTCYNPNKFGLQLTSLESEVFLNKEYLGNALLQSPVAVPRKDTFLIPVKMDVKMGGAMTSLLQLINSSPDSTKLLLKLEGKAKLKKGGILMNVPIHYEEMKWLKF